MIKYLKSIREKLIWSLKIKWLLFGFCATFALVTGLNVAANQLGNSARESNAMLEHTNDVHHAIDKTKFAFEQADFEQRERMVYGASGSLILRGKVWNMYDVLAQTTQDNPAQQTRLESLRRKIGRRFEIYDSLIRISEQQGSEAAVQQALRLRTLDDLREIENEFTAIRDEEWRLYYERSSEARAFRQRRADVTNAAFILIYIVILFSAFVAIKTVCTKAKAAAFYKSELRKAKRTANQEILLDEDLAGQILDILEEKQNLTIKGGENYVN